MSGQHILLSSWDVVNLYRSRLGLQIRPTDASYVAFLCPRIPVLHPRSMNVSWHVSGIWAHGSKKWWRFPRKDVTSKWEGERETGDDRSVFEVFLIGLKSFHRCGQLLGVTSQQWTLREVALRPSLLDFGLACGVAFSWVQTSWLNYPPGNGTWDGGWEDGFSWWKYCQQLTTFGDLSYPSIPPPHTSGWRDFRVEIGGKSVA